MKRYQWMIGVAILAVSVLLGGCGTAGNKAGEGNQQQEQGKQPTEQGQPPAGNVDVAAAEKTYQQNCMSCHGQNLEGAVGPNLSDIGSRKSKEEILGIIQNGKPPKMPGGLVSGEEAENLAAWLASKK